MPGRSRRDWAVSRRGLAAAVAVAGSLLGRLDPEAATPAPATHRVVIGAMSFRPAVLTLRAGDTVVWVNEDPFPHTVTSPAGRFDSRDVAAGQSWKHTPRTRGELAYVCTLHPTMKAVLRVE
jgi:plastocyanin